MEITSPSSALRTQKLADETTSMTGASWSLKGRASLTRALIASRQQQTRDELVDAPILSGVSSVSFHRILVVPEQNSSSWLHDPDPDSGCLALNGVFHCGNKLNSWIVIVIQMRDPSEDPEISQEPPRISKNPCQEDGNIDSPRWR